MLLMEDKKIPITLRLGSDRLRRLDEVLATMRPAVTRTAAIEDAIDAWIEAHAKKGGLRR